jgi:hypothetical protein
MDKSSGASQKRGANEKFSLIGAKDSTQPTQSPLVLPCRLEQEIEIDPGLVQAMAAVLMLPAMMVR